MLAQIKRMERLMRPLGVSVDIESLGDLKAFVDRLVQLTSRVLGDQDYIFEALEVRVTAYNLGCAGSCRRVDRGVR
jgi:hypothetical protein